jgi:oligopeptidase B
MEIRMPTPPSAPKRPHFITQHDRTRQDDYYWLRDREDPQTMTYLEAENDYLKSVLAHTDDLQAALVQEMKARIPERDVSASLQRGDYFYYTRMEPGKEYPIYCRKPVATEDSEEILLDQNLLAEGHPFCGLGAFEVSPDHTLLAYLLDNEGGETFTLHVKDLQTGELLPDSIPNASGYLAARIGLAWTKDQKYLYYTTLDDAHRPYRLYRHTLGSDPALDTLIYEEVDTTYGMYITPSRSEAYLWVQLNSTSSVEYRFLPLASQDSHLKVVIPRQPFIEYSVDHLVAPDGQERLLILTNDGAPNFRLVSAPVEDPSPENWTEIIPNRASVTLEEVQVFKQDLVVIEREDGLRQVRISDSDGTSNLRTIPMPEPAYALEPDINPTYDTRTLRFIYTSLVTPRSVIDYDMATMTWTTTKQDEIPSGYDASLYTTERLHASATDGVMVPISLVYRKDAAPFPAPLVLYGYGSYGTSMDPAFQANRLSLLDRGLTFAIAHIRGGADLGRGWYEDGKLLKKKNTFTDFIACAEFLIAQGYTTRNKLAILGGSAGGLLVGAAMTMRPDLFAAVVARVPFVDVVTTMSDPTIPLTTFEYDQWGNPDDPQYFNYILSYSPYDNLRPTDYPDLLLTTGLNDPRVAFWEPAKFAARLRELKTCDNLVLLHTEFGAGHAGASGRYKALEEVALIYAFLLDRIANS